MRIPASMLAASHGRLDQPVDVREEGGQIVISPLAARCELDTRLAGMTDENRHDQVETGSAMGREAW